MTANPFAALLDGVRRYSYHDYDEDDGFCLREKDVLAALAAAVPADLTEVGNVLEGVTPRPWRHGVRKDGSIWLSLGDPVSGPHYQGDLWAGEPDARFIAWCREGVPALIARIAAQEAQIKGLEAELDEPHWDDHCVNQFAKMMREKMAAARAKGRSGWNDPNQCSVDYLRDLLYEHLDKGDPVDVANFCMMLRHYDASTRRDYGNTLDMWKARAEAAETALAAEQAKVAKLVEVLQFYADKEAWSQPPVRTREGLFSVEYENQASKVQRDRGNIARRVIDEASNG